MEKLIDFLIDNIYIVLVLGGFLLSAIGKMRGGNNRQPRQMPPFGSGEWQSPSDVRPASANHTPAGRPNWDDDEEDEDYKEYSPYAASEPPEQEASARSVDRAVSAAPAAPRRSQAAASDTPHVAVSDASSRPQQELSAVALRQAVIWSEVLGPPRAKRAWRNK
ncbi:hypothetical protein PCCS19_31400 [Paenibacillus sp. CCS19]|uniref:hypothetical protein n=1 Tax=Paenibacillus sp. CCS19 TaxID=3158387 RepID=UPI00256E6695|nr:hypothetical protein [Paenibacillus cellulosilyticus]GMK40085.1 hypothetical protein PCCS19_31400 [Paenibacillus cellulosilyticus]